MDVDSQKDKIERYLQDTLPAPAESEGGQAADAARYSLSVGGKRIRPLLLLQTASLFGVTAEAAMPYAAALEMIHTYSLIHDDLPAMDNDLLRRGKPACHAVYGEAGAILAGDGLLTFAFETLLAALEHDASAPRLEAALLIAKAAGFTGMVAGQSLDLCHQTPADPAAYLVRLQEKKTGALISAAVLAGAILGQANALERTLLDRFAGSLGLAFQIKDDLLDVESTPAELGKTTGKDQRDHKLTFVTLHGQDEAARYFDMEMEKARNALQELAESGLDVTELDKIRRYLEARIN